MTEKEKMDLGDDHVVAAGNPCRVIRAITEKDSIYENEAR